MSILSVNSLFCLELGLGCLVLLPFFPSRDLTRGFFGLHGGIAALAFVLAWSLDRGAGVLPHPWLLGSLLGVSIVGTIASGAGLRRTGHAIFAIGAALAAATFFFGAGATKGPLGIVWLILGSLILGSTTLAMNLGHWYLVTKDLPARHLMNWSAVHLAACWLRAALFLGVVFVVWSGRWGFDLRDRLFSPFGDGFFLATRFLWGNLGSATLSIFVLKTARMRSNQAATGLLYVGLVFVLVGELLAAYLTIRTGVPL